jgi:hypothetical protein
MKQEILKSLLEKINAYGLHEAVRVRLMEQTIASTQAQAFITEFNRVMAAYKTADPRLATYTAQYVKGADDYHGKLAIYKDGKELVQSQQDFGIAVTANLSPGVAAPKDPLDNYSTQLVDGKLMQFSTSFQNVASTADAAVKNQLIAAIRSGVAAVKKQLSPQKTSAPK